MKIEKYKTKKGDRYRFRIYDGYKRDGSQRRKLCSGYKTRKEAELAYLKLLQDSATYNKREPVTVGQVFEDWFSAKRKEIKESTAIKILRNYQINYEEVYQHREMASFSPAELQQIANNLANKYSRPAKYFHDFKALFAYAYRLELIEDNPAERVIIPKRKKELPRDNYYTKEELKLFLNLAKEQLDHKWYVFFYLLAHTGMRRGEALALEWQDISKDKIKIHKSVSRTAEGARVSNTPKTDASNRTIYITERLYSLLQSLNDGSSSFIFSNNKGSFAPESQPIKQLHKIKGIRYISPHGFRHTHCSLLFSAGISIPEVQKRLGHTDVQTTLNIYNHIYKEDERKALEKYSNYIGE